MIKKIPLDLLKVIENADPKLKSNIYITKNENSLALFKDKDENSDFYFDIIRVNPNSSSLAYEIRFCPRDSNDVRSFHTAVTIDTIKRYLDNWLTIIDEYNSVENIFEDPILSEYRKQFETKFEIIDEDADYAPFDLDKQLYIDNYLTDTKNKLHKLKEHKTEPEIKEIEELENEIEDISKNLTTDTKKKVFKRLAKFWAKAQKTGLDIMKEIFVKSVVEVGKWLITGQLNT